MAILVFLVVAGTHSAPYVLSLRDFDAGLHCNLSWQPGVRYTGQEIVHGKLMATGFTRCSGQVWRFHASSSRNDFFPLLFPAAEPPPRWTPPVASSVVRNDVSGRIDLHPVSGPTPNERLTLKRSAPF